jgi:transposase
LCVRHHNDHSPFTFSIPRNQNRKSPRIAICPNTGSMVEPRSLYASRPRFVKSFRSIRSFAEKWAGIRPRGGGASRIALRCFQSFVVAMNSSVSS